MKKIYFTVSPSQPFPKTDLFIKLALKEEITSIFHRSLNGQQVYQSTISNLKKLLRIPTSHQVFFLSSGTECMERVIENCVGKSSFHFVNGYFSKRWYEMALELKKKPQKVEVGWGEGFEFDNISIHKDTELLCFTQNETSTGVTLNPKDITKFKHKYPEKLLAVDAVSASPYADIDYRLIDLVFFSKGFGLPAGLSVMIVSPKALEKSKYLQSKGFNIGSYHSFVTLSNYAQVNQAPEGSNLLYIYLLDQVVKRMLKIGLTKIWHHTEEKAKMLYDFFESHSNFELFVKDPDFRSQTIIVASVKGGSKSLIKKLSNEGLIVSGGHGDALREKQIRIANFPAHQIKDVKRLIRNLKEIK